MKLLKKTDPTLKKTNKNERRSGTANRKKTTRIIGRFRKCSVSTPRNLGPPLNQALQRFLLSPGFELVIGHLTS